MKKITAIEIAILFIAGIVPLLWLREGYIISNGDDFPLFLNSQQVLRTGTYLWSPDFLGYATPTPAYALYQYSGVFLTHLGLSVGSVQIFFQVFLFMLGAFSMYYFSKMIYPGLKFAGFAAGFFYMFNFFALDNRHNIGFLWTYAFLPLLLALFAKIVTSAYRKDDKTANRNIIYFALTSVVAFSFASINPANLALMSFGLAIMVVYYLIKFRRQLRQLLVSFGKIAALTVPINLWWIIPMLNYYFFSPQTFNSSVSVWAWSWTHARASFLNLFWLNGFWGWIPDYAPNFNLYSNPFLIILVFVPFVVAASALLFKGEKSRFNAYIMGAILVLLFLAKGLHEPFGQLNLLIYQNISLMSMFREPASKFTLLIVPFLALLIGYAVGNIANVKVKRFNFHFNKILVVSLLLMTFVAAVSPLIINPIETKTQELPFSSYVKIPNYWYQATNWINSQQGDGKVLITPLDDFYQMPYTWGYYGTDQLIDGLIEKPIVSTANLEGYKINPDTAATLLELNYTMAYRKVDEFKALLDLLNVNYILQRNDVISVMTNGSLMSPVQIKSFFAKQPYIRLVQQFGQLDIYEYTDFKPSLYAISPSSLQKSNIGIETNITLEKDWNFSSVGAIADWQATTYSNQSQSASTVSQDGSYLKTELLNSTGNLEKIESPLLPAQYDSIYSILVGARGQNTSDVEARIVQYTANMSMVSNSWVVKVNWGTFDWTYNQFNFEPLPITKYFRIQIWVDLQANRTTQCTLWLDDVNVTGKIYILNTTGLANLFNDALQNQTATVLNVQNLSPTKMVVTVNASKPFILATTSALDAFWVANVNGEQIKPTSLYLGLQGFQIDKTGQFEITIEYEPQLWFYFASVISISAMAAICALYIYINRDGIKSTFKNIHKKNGALTKVG